MTTRIQTSVYSRNSAAVLKQLPHPSPSTSVQTRSGRANEEATVVWTGKCLTVR